MATMTVANPQALRALEHANHVRSARAQLKRAIAAGTLSAAGAPTRGRAGSRARSRKAGGCRGYRLGRGVLLAGHQDSNLESPVLETRYHLSCSRPICRAFFPRLFRSAIGL